MTVHAEAFTKTDPAHGNGKSSATSGAAKRRVLAKVIVVATFRCNRRYSALAAGASDTQALHIPPQRGAMDPETGGGAADVLAVVREHTPQGLGIEGEGR